MKNRTLSQVSLSSSKYTKEKDFWLKFFSGVKSKNAIVGLIDTNNNNTESVFEKIQISFESNLCNGINKICKNSDNTLHIFLTAVLTELLHRYTGDEDIIIGTPIYRQDQEGDYINTVLAIRSKIEKGQSFKDLLLKVVRPNVIECIKHQNYPFESLLHQLNLGALDGINPLFDVAILLDNIQEKSYLDHIPKRLLFKFNHSSEGQVSCELEYDASVISKSSASNLLLHYEFLAKQLISNIAVPMDDLAMLLPAEQKQVIEDFNSTENTYPSEESVDSLFRETAALNKDKVALKYNGHHITYRELDQRSSQLSSYLQKQGVEKGEPVGIMIGHSVEMIVGLLGILKSGGIYCPINIDYPEERKRSLLADSNIRFLLCKDLEFKNDAVTKIDLTLIELNQEEFAEVSKHTGQDACYIMYTSGSTGQPKGVIINHQNVVRLVKNTNFVNFNSDYRILQTGALEFDASTFELWGSLLNGGTLYLEDKYTIINDQKLKSTLEKNSINTIWMTSPLFNQMLDTDISIFKNLDHLLVGGDVLSTKHINKLRESYPGIKVTNGYGPTENTTFSTTHEITKQYNGNNIPIGKPINNSTAYIIDHKEHILPPEVPGELYVGGDGVGLGYLNNPEYTHEKFIELQDLPGQRFYKTGDKALWLSDGEISFLGRIDYQVKIRGYRIEPGEVESVITSDNEVKESLVIVKENNEGEKYLCAYLVGESDLEISDLKIRLKDSLPDYMLPTYIVKLDKFPLTTNGKIDRKLLPEPEIDFGKELIAPRNPTEKRLLEIWSELLGIEKENIGIDSNFFELGGHSLKATLLTSQIYKILNVELPLSEIFKNQTIRELSLVLESSAEGLYKSISQAPVQSYYALSSAQMRLYILDQMDMTSTSYNIPMAFILEGDIDLKKLINTLQKLVKRHAALRTSFVQVDQIPKQRIAEDAELQVKYYSESTVTPRELFSDFVQAFDLSQAPLMRVSLVKQNEGQYLFMIDMHHIITDGTSLAILVREFMQLYSGLELKPLPIQYSDFSEWQNELLSTKQIDKQKDFWTEEFKEEISIMELPCDYSRPPVQSFEGRSLKFTISPELTSKLKDICLSEDKTMFMVLLSAYNVLLSKLSNQSDIVIGTPIAGRRHPDLENIVGMFINTLVLRNFPAGDKTLKNFLEEVKEKTIKVYDNQDYQFEDLVRQLSLTNDTSRNPIFDVAFSFHNESAPGNIDSISIPGLSLQAYNPTITTTKFDLTLSSSEVRDQLQFSFQYCTKLFKKETIERFKDYFVKILESISTDLHQKISQIEIISDQERDWIIAQQDQTSVSYPTNKLLHRIFEEQVEKQGDKIAAKFGDQQISYRELNNKANQLGHALQQDGIGLNSIVGLIQDKSIEMLISILGVLKAGGSYLPINPTYPQERIEFLINDSNADLVIVSNETSGETIKPQINVNSLFGTDLSTSNLVLEQTSESAAYIIYTSGTTGKPKGVIINHENVVRLLFNESNLFDFNDQDVWSMFHAYNFDFSVWEFYGSLLKGGELIVLSDTEVKDANLISEKILKENITVFNQTPASFYNLKNSNESLLNKNLQLRYVIFGGDALAPAKLKIWKDHFPEIKFINMYGITETTVHVSYKEISDNEIARGKSNIGKSIPTLASYILDENQELLPQGAGGEICVSGAGISMGYLNNPELTHEKFIINPFKPGEYIYRSGDKGRILPDGDIEYLGRIDQQVKIRGYRIELAEIEKVLLKHENIEKCVVIVKEDSEDKHLCSYIVYEKEIEQEELRTYLSNHLPDYMIPSYFVKMDTLPLTANGKVNRKALPNPEVKAGDDYVAPSNELEKKMVSIWSEVLDVPEEELSVMANFFALGGHSLKAMDVTNKIQEIFNVAVPLTQVLNSLTIRSLVLLISVKVDQEENLEYEEVEF
ncbi:MAG: amino acid adenylation domain-containing protein [Bacteroidales bacterium]|nr:amino acid adenylation domain-containing protein [Bacteroidales bacterium]